jgi:hypothetical protein
VVALGVIGVLTRQSDKATETADARTPTAVATSTATSVAPPPTSTGCIDKETALAEVHDVGKALRETGQAATQGDAQLASFWALIATDDFHKIAKAAKADPVIASASLRAARHLESAAHDVSKGLWGLAVIEMRLATVAMNEASFAVRATTVQGC